jgi:hypothetical protein
MEPVKELKTNRKANDMESKAMVLSEEIRNEERELDWLDSALEKATVELKSLEEAFDFGPKWESKEDYVSSIFHEREETAMRLGRLLEEFKLELADAGWLLTGRMVCKRETIQSEMEKAARDIKADTQAQLKKSADALRGMQLKALARGSTDYARGLDVGIAEINLVAEVLDACAKIDLKWAEKGADCEG